MDARMFRNTVLKMAEDAGLKFLLIVEGEVASRGSLEEIIQSENSTHNKPYASSLVKGARETYHDLFNLFRSLPVEDPEHPDALYLSSTDIEDFRIPSGSDYYITVSSNQMEFMVVAGSIEDGGIPLINVTFTNSGEVVISTIALAKEGDKEDGEDLMVTNSTLCVSIDTMIQTSLLRFNDLPSHIATEVETFIIAAIRTTQG